MNIYRILFWLFALATVACFAVGGWLWWSERDAPLLVVDEPVAEVGAVPRGEMRNVEIFVTNTSAEALSLAGLDGELC
jgi:hypothetical protein